LDLLERHGQRKNPYVNLYMVEMFSNFLGAATGTKACRCNSRTRRPVAKRRQLQGMAAVEASVASSLMERSFAQWSRCSLRQSWQTSRDRQFPTTVLNIDPTFMST